MSTYFPKPGEIVRKWHVVDADGQTLGRMASQVARILMGKENPQYTPFLDTGDHVIVINAERVKLTGNKIDQKIYRHHSGYPGGLKEIPIRRMLERRPEEVVREAVLGMLPKNKLRARRAKKLRVYAGSEALARHSGQKPQPLAL